MKSIIRIATMLLAGMLLLFAVPAFSQKSTAEKSAKEAADAAKAAADEAAKPEDERDCAKIVAEVNKAKAAAKKAKAAAKAASDDHDNEPEDDAKFQEAKAAQEAAEAAQKSLDDAYKAAPGMKVAEDIKKKVDGTSESENSKVKKIKDNIKKAADEAGNANPCDPDAVKRAVEKKLEEEGKNAEKNKEVKTWFDRNFPEKDGKRLNISYDGGSMDDLVFTAIGTGNTTGHVATLTLTNPTGQPITTTFDNLFIPSGGQYQPYIVPSRPPVTVAPHSTVEVPLTGWCADVFSKPAPAGEALPPFENWVNATPASMTNFTPTAGAGWIPVPPGGSGFVPTIPGTDQPVGYSIDPKRYPTQAAPLLSEALNAIADTYDRLAQSGEITTPFSGNPEKEREAVIQQTFWKYASALSGKEYSKEDFRANTIRQYETSTGRTFAKQDEKTRQSVENGVNDFWITFEAVGVEAKVLANTNDAPAENWGPIVEKYYQTYSLARQTGNSHDEAMKAAVLDANLRKHWGPEFKKRYEKK